MISAFDMWAVGLSLVRYTAGMANGEKTSWKQWTDELGS